MSNIDGFALATQLAYRGELSFLDLINQANALEALRHGELAVVLYDTWLAHTQTQYAHAALFNLAIALANLNELVRAAEAYRKAIALAPGFMHPRLNLGLLYERQGRIEEALTEWRWIDLNAPREESNIPVLLLALNNLGRLCEVRSELQQASEYLVRSLQLNPDQTDVVHHWLFLRQKQCLWPVYGSVVGLSELAMRQSTSALSMLSLSDDPAAQLDAAVRFVATKTALNLSALSEHRGYGHSKIRIAYCSSDFCLHPVAALTVELFELHDREKFEIYGFCWSPEDGSGLRQRVKDAMDHFYTVYHLSDEAAAQLIRSHEIDVLVDLQGQTAGARANILGYRPAPIQITYLGLPATTGLPSIGYVIADEFLIPPTQTQYFSESPLYMPDVFQVSDRQRVSAATPSRESCGLPNDGFVFCSLNNNFKYTPEMFDVWMRLLRAVPNSVLWLLADNPWAESNLRREARQRGVFEGRLVFAKRVSPEMFLARLAIADLFLDTFPFNAGTTANDCLWAGCPLLTLAGRSFASRMAGALLTAAKLPGLVTYDVASYEATASALAGDPERCASLRAQLREVRSSGKLFDTPGFARALEARLTALVARLTVAV